MATRNLTNYANLKMNSIGTPKMLGDAMTAYIQTVRDTFDQILRTSNTVSSSGTCWKPCCSCAGRRWSATIGAGVGVSLRTHLCAFFSLAGDRKRNHHLLDEHPIRNPAGIWFETSQEAPSWDSSADPERGPGVN